MLFREPIHRLLPSAVLAAMSHVAVGHGLVPAKTLIQRSAFQTLPVVNCNDSGPGSLRSAYLAAANDETIDLTKLTCSRITLSGALKQSEMPAGSVFIEGAGVTIDANNLDRAIAHGGAGRLTLIGVNVTNGLYRGPAGGGCIYSAGSVDIKDAAVSNCELITSGGIAATGGAIFARQSVTLVASSITSNSALSDTGDAKGGAIYARIVQLAEGSDTSGATLSGNSVSSGSAQASIEGGAVHAATIQGFNSTLSGNRAGVGAAFSGQLANLENVTVSGNVTTNGSGAVDAINGVALDHCTIVSNVTSAGFPGGVFAGSGSVSNTIIANNKNDDGSAAIDMGSGPDGGGIAFSNDLIIRANFPITAGTITSDPMISPLENHGGRRLTHALLPSSPAINKGAHTSTSLYDTRGFPFSRVDGSASDIGAFESSDRLFYDGLDL